MFDFTIRDQKYMNMAAKIAAGSIPHAGARVVSVIALRNHILSIGVNSSKTHPFQAKFSKNDHALYWHAETRAISLALKNGYKDLLKKSSLYVLRLTKAGRPAISMPCPGCAKAISVHNVGRVIYSKGDENFTDTPSMSHFCLN